MPTMPAPGTDNHRLLVDLQAAFPAPAWDVNRRLGIVGNSRASDLRDDYGWDVESIRGDAVPGTRKRHWGYRLLTPRSEWPNAVIVADDDGQLRIA